MAGNRLSYMDVINPAVKNVVAWENCPYVRCNISAGPLVRLNGSLDREGKVKKSGPDRSIFGKKCKIRSISDLDIGR